MAGGVGRGDIGEFFFTKNPNQNRKQQQQKKKHSFSGGWEGAGKGVDGWTDEQSQTNLSLQLFRSYGHNNALMFKLCP